MFDRLPQNPALAVPVCHTSFIRGPFGDIYREVDLELKGLLTLGDEFPRSGGTDDCKRVRVLHLAPKHDHTGNPQAVVRMQVGYGDQLQPAHSEPRPFPVDLRALPGIEEIYKAIEPYRQGREHPVGHRHHPAGPDQYAFQFAVLIASLSQGRTADLASFCRNRSGTLI
jgi:hypothetical protein